MRHLYYDTCSMKMQLQQIQDDWTACCYASFDALHTQKIAIDMTCVNTFEGKRCLCRWGCDESVLCMLDPMIKFEAICCK